MLLDVGINANTGDVRAYNEETKEITKLEVVGVMADDLEKIDAMYKKIKEMLDGGEIGCVCVYVESYYGNEIREKFIEIGENHGFLQVQIIELSTFIYLAFIFKANYKPKNGDVIWIIWSGNCYIFEKINGKARLIKSISVINLEKEWILFKIKESSELNTNPNLILHDYFEIDKNKAAKNFPKCKCMEIEPLSYAGAALLKARIMAGDTEVMDFDVEIILEIYMKLMIDGEKIMSFNKFDLLPIEKIHILHIKNWENMLNADFEDDLLETHDIVVEDAFHKHVQDKISIDFPTDVILTIKIDENRICSVIYLIYEDEDTIIYQ